MATKEDKAHEVHTAVQKLGKDFDRGQALFDKVKDQMGTLGRLVSDTTQDTVSLACALRKSVVMVLKLNELDKSITQGCKEACDQIHKLFHQFNWDPANDISVIKNVIKRAFEVFEMFRKMGARLIATIDISKSVKDMLTTWAKKVQEIAHTTAQSFKEDIFAVGQCCKKVACHVAFMCEEKCTCSREEETPGGGAVQPGGESKQNVQASDLADYALKLIAAIAKYIVGEDGIEAVEKIDKEAGDVSKRLESVHDEVFSWYKDLTRKADWKDFFTLGLDRPVAAIGLNLSCIKGLCNLPSIMTDAQDMVHNSTQILPKIREHWLDIWHKFVDCVQRLCGRLGIVFPDRFKDPTNEEDEIFSRTRGSFLGDSAHTVLHCWNSQCMQGTKKMCSDAKSCGYRFCERKYFHLNYYHLQRPKTNYVDSLPSN
jgi:hypothetical protein